MQIDSNLKHPSTGWYSGLLGDWSTRECGPKPTQGMLAAAHLLDRSKRPGVEALHIAMCLREAGCTVRQFMIAGQCGPANNYRRALVAAGLVKATVEGKPYAYKLIITAKGEHAIAKAVAALAAEAETAKVPPAKTKKARKAKPEVTVPAVVPAGNPEPEPTPETTAEARKAEYATAEAAEAAV